MKKPRIIPVVNVLAKPELNPGICQLRHNYKKVIPPARLHQDDSDGDAPGRNGGDLTSFEEFFGDQGFAEDSRHDSCLGLIAITIRSCWINRQFQRVLIIASLACIYKLQNQIAI